MSSVENSCLRCGRCCTSFGVCVTPFDIARISHSTGLKPDEFIWAIPEPPEREREEPAVLIDGERLMVVLKWKKGRICWFYSGNGCRIYENRPIICMTYPFALKEAVLVDTKSRACPKLWFPEPGTTYLEDLKQYQEEVRAYRQIAEEWNGGPGGDLKAFLVFALESGKKYIFKH